ncbi:MAG: DUF2892 domain-containing protein [Elusimicrobiota bacterium]|jgi:hypothetical protein
MSIEHKIRVIAGSIILVSLGLAVKSDIRWLWLTAFVGANLIQSAFTKWCLMEKILQRFEAKSSDDCCCCGGKEDSRKQP